MNDLIVLSGKKAVLDANTASRLSTLERMAKMLKAEQDALKEAILNEMEARGLIKVDAEDLTITYIAATDRETFDSKSFRKDHPEEYDRYVKISQVKPSIRVKIHE